MFPRTGSATQETTTTTQETADTAQENRGAPQETSQETNSSTQELDIPATQKVLEALRSNPTLTLAELAQQLGMSRDGVKYHVNLLKKNVGLHHEGPSKKGRWVLPESQSSGEHKE